MQPHNRAPNIEQPTMQPIPLAQVNRRHPRPPPPIIPLVIPLDRLLPELSRLTRAVLAKPNVDQEIAEVVVRDEVWCGLVRRPRIDRARASGDTIPAAEATRALRLVVKGGSQGNDALNLKSRWHISIVVTPERDDDRCTGKGRARGRGNGNYTPYPAPTTPSAP